MAAQISPKVVCNDENTCHRGSIVEERKSSITARVKTMLRRLSGRPPVLILHHHDSLGFGGHAQVVSGTLDDKKVAVKILPSSDPSTRREIRAATSLPPHPNVVTAASAVASRSRNSMYLPMELGECDALAKFVERGQATPTDVVELFRGVAAGLAHLHANGIYHLDIKPENILLVDGVGKLCDLGHW